MASGNEKIQTPERRTELAMIDEEALHLGEDGQNTSLEPEQHTPEKLCTKLELIPKRESSDQERSPVEGDQSAKLKE